MAKRERYQFGQDELEEINRKKQEYEELRERTAEKIKQLNLKFPDKEARLAYLDEKIFALRHADYLENKPAGQRIKSELEEVGQKDFNLQQAMFIDEEYKRLDVLSDLYKKQIDQSYKLSKELKHQYVKQLEVLNLQAKIFLAKKNIEMYDKTVADMGEVIKELKMHNKI